MCLRKKAIVYFDIEGKVYKFKNDKSNFGCRSCKMSIGGKCDKTLSNPIKTGKTMYFRINALCRKINGRIYKKYIIV